MSPGSRRARGEPPDTLKVSGHGGQLKEEVVATARSRLIAAETGIVRQPRKDEPNVDMSPFVDSNCLGETALTTVNRTISPLFASVTVDMDKTVFLQMAVFALLILALKPLLFDPMLRVFALREERTDGAKADARRMQERAAEILSSYEAEVSKVRTDATAERDRLRKETSHLEARILAEGRTAAEAITADGRAKIFAEMTLLQHDLDETARRVGREISSHVLGREVNQ